MMDNLLLLYEISYQAQKVKSKRALKEFESWIKNVLTAYQDVVVERVALMHLFRLKEQYGPA